MNKFVSILSFLAILVLTLNTAFSQDIEVVVHRTYIDSTLGSEMIFDFEVINISQFQQTVFEVRTINDLPSGWQSSLCFGINCFSPDLDSIATMQPFGDPLQPGDTLITSLHVYSLTTEGTANVQIQVGTFRNPTVRTTLNFVATTIPTSVEGENTVVDNYYLEQNYPNPFNPSTKINYGLKKSGNVEITVYNVLGNKVATLVNGYKSAGMHSVDFNAANLASGIYFYKIVTPGFIQTKKMILEK
ncbi:MAG TPA: T9SS type A sorting domain-containing protein [Ignavibacteriaceae bacterium]